MFPEIVRDDIFRLETRRLWLRWPSASDLKLDVQAPARGASTDPAKIAAWRSAMESGAALHLMLVRKGNEHDVLGSVHLADTGAGGFGLRYRLDGEWHGVGLMTEAVQGAIDAAFLLGALGEIGASPAVLDTGSRRVLERCGFTYVSQGLCENQADKGLIACDRFRLDRKTWRSWKGWRHALPSSSMTPPTSIDPLGYASA